jgi:replicative DNA helicase
LSRAVETRKESKMPQLSDLRESGAIEQDADMVMFIYRPEYYEVMSNDMGESTHGETHIRIAKHRNGQLDTIKLRAKLDIQKFEEWDGDGAGFGSSNWKPVAPGSTAGTGAQDSPKLFIQKESKMNEGDFDAGFDNETPF